MWSHPFFCNKKMILEDETTVLADWNLKIYVYVTYMLQSMLDSFIPNDGILMDRKIINSEADSTLFICLNLETSHFKLGKIQKKVHSSQNQILSSFKVTITWCGSFPLTTKIKVSAILKLKSKCISRWDSLGYSWGWNRSSCSWHETLDSTYGHGHSPPTWWGVDSWHQKIFRVPRSLFFGSAKLTMESIESNMKLYFFAFHKSRSNSFHPSVSYSYLLQTLPYFNHSDHSQCGCFLFVPSKPTCPMEGLLDQTTKMRHADYNIWLLILSHGHQMGRKLNFKWMLSSKCCNLKLKSRWRTTKKAHLDITTHHMCIGDHGQSELELRSNDLYGTHTQLPQNRDTPMTVPENKEAH